MRLGRHDFHSTLTRGCSSQLLRDRREPQMKLRTHTGTSESSLCSSPGAHWLYTRPGLVTLREISALSF